MRQSDFPINLDKPGTYTYIIWRYYAGHQVMFIRVNGASIGEDVFWLGLVGVTYFEGPTGWSNADFFLGEKEECIAILKAKGLENAELPVNEGYFHLFKVKLPKTEIKIVASTIYKIEDEKFAEILRNWE